MSNYLCVAKFYLDTEIDFDYSLIGINTVSGDYRLSWNLNKLLKLDLRKAPEPVIIADRTSAVDSRFYYHKYFDREAQALYVLFGNKSGSAYLIPEQKKADFVLMVEHSDILDPGNLLKKIQEIKQVQMAFHIDAEGLKSKNNLLLAT